MKYFVAIQTFLLLVIIFVMFFKGEQATSQNTIIQHKLDSLQSIIELQEVRIQRNNIFKDSLINVDNHIVNNYTRIYEQIYNTPDSMQFNILEELLTRHRQLDSIKD
jgi:hypothetical protein